MASQMGAVRLYPGLLMENVNSERSCISLATTGIHNDPSFSGGISKIRIKFTHLQSRSTQSQRHGWRIAFALDTGGVPGNGGPENLNGNNTDLGRTRLGRIVSTGGKQLLEKLNSARKNLPMKIFLLLLGFYTANALATILGQTGDWDVLVAGVVVAAIEGIGVLMYKRPPLPSRRLQSFVAMMNYWKAGI